MQISQRTNLSDSEHRLLGWLDFSLSLVPVSRKWPMANDKTECQAQAYCLPSREITCGFVLPVYLFIMCYVKWEMASGWLQRFNNATQPIVELHTWFWVSISSPCSIIHGLTQIATLKIFCHSRPYISSIMEIHIPDITIPWRHITHLKEKWPTNLGCCSFLRVFDYQYVENLPVLLLHWAFLADKLC